MLGTRHLVPGAVAVLGLVLSFGAASAQDKSS